jgi:hypothetical protein
LIGSRFKKFGDLIKISSLKKSECATKFFVVFFVQKTLKTSFSKVLKDEMASTSSSAVRALALELKSLQEEPLEGIRCRLVRLELFTHRRNLALLFG